MLPDKVFEYFVVALYCVRGLTQDRLSSQHSFALISEDHRYPQFVQEFLPKNVRRDDACNVSLRGIKTAPRGGGDPARRKLGSCKRNRAHRAAKLGAFNVSTDILPMTRGRGARATLQNPTMTGSGSSFTPHISSTRSWI